MPYAPKKETVPERNTVQTVTKTVFLNTTPKFIVSIAWEKLSRYRLDGNEIKEVRISPFGFRAFITISSTGRINNSPNKKQSAVLIHVNVF